VKSSSVFSGRIGIVIETAPGQFMSVVLRGRSATIEREVDDVTDYFADSFKRYAPSNRMRIEVEGYVMSEQETAANDAAWVTKAAGEIEAPRRALSDREGA
jgi:hypothetical protein